MGKIDKLSVDIPADFLAYAESAVAGGEFVSVEHVVDSALRAWQLKREADLSKLRDLIEEGLAGPFEAWDGVDGIIADARRKMDNREA